MESQFFFHLINLVVRFFACDLLKDFASAGVAYFFSQSINFFYLKIAMKNYKKLQYLPQ